MGYELREHTADVAVEATAESPGAVFGAVADGMAAAMTAEWPERGGATHAVNVDAESREALLFDYLDTLIYERDVRSVLPVDNTASVERLPGLETADGTEERTDRRDERAGGADKRNERLDERVGETAGTEVAQGGDDETERWRLEGEYRGVELSRVSARDLKAVTYSQMALEETADGWRAYVVFDV
jgi:SHS2 domain-containing protein